MGFYTEMFSRPRPQDAERLRNAMALLEPASRPERPEIGDRPVDFPRLARATSARRLTRLSS